jgi:arsenate reductase
MAEGLAKAMGGERVYATSAGTAPADGVASKAVQAMAQLGIDIRDQQPTQLTRELLEAADRVFIMGCDARSMCPVDWLDDAIDWDIEDPMGKGLGKYIMVRDVIRIHLERALRAEGIEPRPVG